MSAPGDRTTASHAATSVPGGTKSASPSRRINAISGRIGLRLSAVDGACIKATRYPACTQTSRSERIRNPQSPRRDRSPTITRSGVTTSDTNNCILKSWRRISEKRQNSYQMVAQKGCSLSTVLARVFLQDELRWDRDKSGNPFCLLLPRVEVTSVKVV